MGANNQKHHKTPRVYLESFTDDKGYIWIADSSLKLYSQKPIAALREDNYYTIRFPAGGGTLKVETKLLGGIEAAYGDLYKEKISKHVELTDEEKVVMSVFVASMMARSPNLRSSLKRFFKDLNETVDAMNSLPEKNKQAWAALPMLAERESIAADEFLEVGKDIGSLHTSLIPDTVTSLAPLIYGMGWYFMLRPDGAESFVTSDAPCVSHIPTLPRDSIYQGGLGHKDVEVTLPLSPDISLFMGHQIENGGKYITIDDEHMGIFNRRTMQFGGEQVISSSKEQLEQEIMLAKQYKEKSARRSSSD